MWKEIDRFVTYTRSGFWTLLGVSLLAGIVLHVACTPAKNAVNTACTVIDLASEACAIVRLPSGEEVPLSKDELGAFAKRTLAARQADGGAP